MFWKLDLIRLKVPENMFEIIKFVLLLTFIGDEKSLQYKKEKKYAVVTIKMCT